MHPQDCTSLFFQHEQCLLACRKQRKDFCLFTAMSLKSDWNLLQCMEVSGFTSSNQNLTKSFNWHLCAKSCVTTHNCHIGTIESKGWRDLENHLVQLPAKMQTLKFLNRSRKMVIHALPKNVQGRSFYNFTKTTCSTVMIPLIKKGGGGGLDNLNLLCCSLNYCLVPCLMWQREKCFPSSLWQSEKFDNHCHVPPFISLSPD